jgi:uncharacterized protein YyaL (SSP411 family)
VPHFEIMLYDNAMLLWIYAEAHRLTGEARYAAVARGIADFVLREMTADSGAFFTAMDAEVDGREGANYLWTRKEVDEALADGGRFSQVYGLDQGPNFGDPHHDNGSMEKNVLFLAEPEGGAALVDKELEAGRQILYRLRQTRKQPRLDRKILTSWNALMIRGLAHAGEILKEGRYVQAAEKCADYLMKAHRDSDGGLLRGGGKQPAFLDDYAFLIQALLALHRVEPARELAKVMRDRFYDAGEGGFFYTEERAADLIVRQMVGSDSPLPSGNGVAAIALIELGDSEIARSTIAAFAGQMEGAGEGMSALVQAALVYLRKNGDVLVAGEKSADRPRSPVELAADVVDIESRWEGAILRVHCSIAAGYHLNAHDAAVEPTRLTATGAEIAQVGYPDAELTGDFEILVRFKSPPKGAFVVNLSYQACDESACLPKATRIIQIAARN